MAIEELNELNMDEIISRVGFPSELKELRHTYKYNVDVKRALKFEHEFAGVQKYEDVQRIAREYSDVFDKEIYVLHMGRLLEKDIEKHKSAKLFGFKFKPVVYLDRSLGIDEERAFLNSKQLLKNSNVVDLEVNSVTGEIKIYSSRDFVGNNAGDKKRKRTSEERLKKIDEVLGLGDVVRNITPSDLIEICNYPNLGNLLACTLYKKKEEVGENEEAIKQITEGLSEEELKRAKVFDYDELESTIRKYIEYIDIDKMLVVSALLYRERFGEDFESLKVEDARSLKSFVEKTEQLLKDKSKKLKIPGKDFSIDFGLIKEAVEILNTRFIGGKYYNSEMLCDLRLQLLNGSTPISFVTKEEYNNALNFELEEVLLLVNNNPSNLQYLIDNGILSESDLEEIFELKENFADEQILYLVSNQKVSDEKLLGLYNEGKVTLANMDFVKMNLEDKDFTSMVSVEKLVELYLDQNRKEEFEKYRKLYKLLVIDETAKEQREKRENENNPEGLKEIETRIIQRRREIATEILGQSDELLEEDKLYGLYDIGIIPIDTVVDYIGVDSLNKMLVSGEVKPTDARRLFDDGIITIEMLKEIYQKQDLSEEQKMVLMFSMFSEDTELDNKMIEELEKYLSTPEDLHKSKIDPRDKKTQKKKDLDYEEDNIPSSLYDEFKGKKVTSPKYRWSLIANLDSQYSQEYLKDGHIIFHLPNERKYIIERLYDKNKNYAYGAATYILDEDVFEQRKDKIIIDGKVDRTYVASLKKDTVKGVKKIVHAGWGNAIVKFFDIENSKKYTPAQKEKIKKLAEMVEKSKRPLSRDDD